MENIKSELARYLKREDLMHSVLLLGKICDIGFDPTPHVEQILELSAQVWNGSSRVRKDVVLQIERINEVLFKEFGLRAKDEKYKHIIDDPTRLYLHRVLKSKQGNPIAVSALYAILCDQVGISYQCIAVHNQYYLKIQDVSGPFFVDPFDSGKILSEEAFQKKVRLNLNRTRTFPANLYEVLDVRQFVSRIAQQLKHIYILKSSAFEALRAVELLTVLFPQSPELTRDRGILYCEMEYFSKAMEDLTLYLRRRPQADDVSEIRKLTHMLSGYQEIMN